MQKDNASTKIDRVDTPHDATSEDDNETDTESKGFDINQFFMSETILPFSGGVRSYLDIMRIILFYSASVHRIEIVQSPNARSIDTKGKFSSLCSR